MTTESDQHTGPETPRRPGRRTALVAALVAGGVAAAYLLAPAPAGQGTDAGGADAKPAGPPTVAFEDVAQAAGFRFRMAFLPNEQGERFKINMYDHGCGVAVADYDGDGREDVYFCNQLGPNALYRNEGGGRFTDVTQAAGPLALADRVSVAAVFADYDNDGDQDLYVTSTRGGNSFFRNRGDGTFEDYTEKAGLSLVAHSQVATFFDADADGLLDLFVTNTAKWTTDVRDPNGISYVGLESILQLVDHSQGATESNRLYRNRGDGTFEDATEAAGLAGPGWGGDAAVFDYDDDGDLDVLVANMFGRSSLYANDGKGRFREVGLEVLGRTPYGTTGARVFDYDGDGRLDLFLVDMHSDMWLLRMTDPRAYPETTKFAAPTGPPLAANSAPGALEKRRRTDAAYAARRDLFYGNALYRNLGGGRFQETSDAAGVETLWPWGIATGDFDADGYEDAYLPSGMGYPFAYWRSPLLMNRHDGTFVDRSREAGLDPLPGGIHLPGTIGGHRPTRSQRSAATADFDGDGRLDLVVQNFNDVPFLLMNRSPKRHTVEMRLVGNGTRSPRDAIGAVVRLTVGGRTLVRQVSSAAGYLSQSSRTLHFGLADATKVDHAEIRWPSGLRQTLADVPVDGVEPLLVTEPTK